MWHPCYLANVRSVCNKLDELKHMLDSENYAVIAFTETFLSSDIPDSLVLCSCSKYVLFRSDWLTFGGGVAMFCCANFNPVKVLVDFSATDCECLVIDLHGSLNCHLICCYHPPSASATATEELCQQLAKVCHCQKQIVLVGDFNLPMIDWATYSAPNTQQCNSFLGFVNSAGLTQLVLSPTRHANLLDLVFASEELQVSGVNVVEGFGSSDHSAVQFSLLGSKEFQKTAMSRQRDFRHMDIPLAKALLSETNWKALLDSSLDVHVLWDIFSRVIEDVFSATVPFKVSGQNAPKYPKSIRKLLRQKKALFHRHKSTGSPLDTEAYRVVCHECSAAIRSVRFAQESEVLSSGCLSRFYAYTKKRRSLKMGL